MEQVRFGMIGAGNIGNTHIKNFMEGKIECGVLTAIADLNPKKLEAVKEKYAENPLMKDVQFFDSDESLIASGACDVVIVGIPHYDHPTVAIKALKAGLHIVVEKPAGVYTKQVKEMIEEAKKHPDQLFGIMFNQRTNPYFKKMKEMIENGDLGEIKRTNWLITDWYRTQTYYDSGDWRATWSGEGGGVLMNQAPHNIDLFWWIAGMVPTKVRAFCHAGKWHDIEVEDDVTAYFEYENGATGCFITTTGDCPGTNRFEICGTRGKLVYENVVTGSGKDQKKNTLTFHKLSVDEREYNVSGDSGNGMKKPSFEVEEIEIDAPNPQHAGILSNVAKAALGIEPLYARAEEGLYGVQLANAMILSSWLGETVELPLNDDLYYEELMKRVKTSRRKAPVKDSGAAVDLDGTY
ncbi:MAG: Gfo/Idh/MocA family oxidoreductase [Ruminococcaceae bacterium]|nr:Gfo/Idh/MocA family oxidoreductase [Oscillospiraceae bacterium]